MNQRLQKTGDRKQKEFQSCNGTPEDALSSLILLQKVKASEIGIFYQSAEQAAFRADCSLPASGTFPKLFFLWISLMFKKWWENLVLPTDAADRDPDTPYWRCIIPGKKMGNEAIEAKAMMDDTPQVNYKGNQYYIKHLGLRLAAICDHTF